MVHHGNTTYDDASSLVSFEQVSAVFHLPFADACESLGLDAGTMRKMCRRYGIMYDYKAAHYWLGDGRIV